MQIGSGEQTLILGAPGCGKTTRLLQLMEDELAAGVDSKRIAYVSFTKKAVREATQRAMDKFGVNARALPFFKTIHSLCFQECAITKEMVMSRSDYKGLGDLLGMSFLSGGEVDDESGMPTTDAGLGDKMLFLDALARAMCISHEEAWNRFSDNAFSWHHFKLYLDASRAYKYDHGLYDFSDMLALFLEQGLTVDADVVIIDEAQDLSLSQWAVMRQAFKPAQRVYIAGDDDQAIYKWSGADVPTFLSLSGRREVLAQSYRLPRSIYKFSQRIIAPVSQRIEKRFAPRNDEGEVAWVTAPEHVDIDPARGSWLVLARNVFLLSPLEAYLKRTGVPYLARHGHTSVKAPSVRAILTWERLRRGMPQPGIDVRTAFEFLRVGSGLRRHFREQHRMQDNVEYSMDELRRDWGLLRNDEWHEAFEEMNIVEREYYLAILRRGGTKALTQPAVVHVNTIHGVKGGEADNVLLLSDMARKTFNEYAMAEDDERRVFYVGATRARHALHVCTPQRAAAFQF